MCLPLASSALATLVSLLFLKQIKISLLLLLPSRPFPFTVPSGTFFPQISFFPPHCLPDFHQMSYWQCTTPNHSLELYIPIPSILFCYVFNLSPHNHLTKHLLVDTFSYHLPHKGENVYLFFIYGYIFMIPSILCPDLRMLPCTQEIGPHHRLPALWARKGLGL